MSQCAISNSFKFENIRNLQMQSSTLCLKKTFRSDAVKVRWYIHKSLCCKLSN